MSQFRGDLIDRLIQRFELDIFESDEDAMAGVVRMILEDQQNHLPTHPPLRGPIAAFLDSYKKEITNG